MIRMFKILKLVMEGCAGIAILALVMGVACLILQSVEVAGLLVEISFMVGLSTFVCWEMIEKLEKRYIKLQEDEKK